MVGSLIATFLIELIKSMAEHLGKAMFHVKSRVRKLKPFNRRKKPKRDYNAPAE